MVTPDPAPVTGANAPVAKGRRIAGRIAERRSFIVLISIVVVKSLSRNDGSTQLFCVEVY